MFKVCFVFAAALGTLASLPVSAREDIVPGSRYISARGSAMGDATLPLGDDGASGLFNNPATLGKLRSGNIELMNLALSATPGFVGSFGADTIKAVSLSSYAPTLTSRPNSMSGFGGQFAPCVYIRGLAIGLLAQAESEAVYRNNGVLTYRSMYRFVPSAGGALRLADGIVRIGYSVQWVNQSSGSVDTTTTASPLTYNTGLKDGSALSHTIGYALTLPYKYLPSFNFVARNILGTRFSSKPVLPMTAQATGRLPTEPMSLDASLSISPRLGGTSFLNLVAQYRDITNQSKVSILGRVVGGFELSLKDRVSFRGGIGSGYPSLGFGLKSKKSELGISWYSEEIGSGYHSVRDVKYMFQYQIKVL